VKCPIRFTISPPEAMLLEINLRGAGLDFQLHRDWMRQIGRVLLDKSQGAIFIESESDIWFLRDSIDPNSSVGDISGLDLITRVYGLLLGHNVKLLEEGKEDANENENQNTDEDRTEDRPEAAAVPGEILPFAKGESRSRDISHAETEELP